LGAPVKVTPPPPPPIRLTDPAAEMDTGDGESMMTPWTLDDNVTAPEVGYATALDGRVVIAVAMLLASVPAVPLSNVIVWVDPDVPPGTVTATMTTPTCWLY
jgi:hypothetical protein